MATKVCENGHHYDSSIYGNNCPFCPSHSSTRVADNSSETVVNENNNAYGGFPGGEKKTEAYNPAGGDLGGGETVFRPANGAASGGGTYAKRIVGLLVTYDTKPSGEVFNLYEGRNVIGRVPKESNIVINDENISSKHLLILYRSAEPNVFRATDLESSNGTYINGEFVVETTKLKSYDQIVIGHTKFIFIALPQE